MNIIGKPPRGHVTLARATILPAFYMYDISPHLYEKCHLGPHTSLDRILIKTTLGPVYDTCPHYCPHCSCRQAIGSFHRLCGKMRVTWLPAGNWLATMNLVRSHLKAPESSLCPSPSFAAWVATWLAPCPFLCCPGIKFMFASVVNELCFACS